MVENFFTKIWYGKTLSCRTSLKSGTAAAVTAVPAAPPMAVRRQTSTPVTEEIPGAEWSSAHAVA